MADSNEGQFIEGVSSQTGIDPRVVRAWSQVEGAYAPGGTGGFNYLNLRPYQGDPYSSVSSGGFEQFDSVDNAIAATVRRLRQPFASAIIDAARTNPTPGEEIAAIASTGWDAGHYGGTGGPSMRSTFASLFGESSLTSSYMGGGVVNAGQAPVTSDGGGGQDREPHKLYPATGGNVPLPGQSGGIGVGQGVIDATKGAASAVSGTVSGASDGFKFIFSYRGLEVLGGAILIIIGLVGLSREVGGPTISLPGVGGSTSPTTSTAPASPKPDKHDPDRAYAEGQRQGEAAAARRAGRNSVADASRATTASGESQSERSARLQSESDAFGGDIPF